MQEDRKVPSYGVSKTHLGLLNNARNGLPFNLLRRPGLEKRRKKNTHTHQMNKTNPELIK